MARKPPIPKSILFSEGSLIGALKPQPRKKRKSKTKSKAAAKKTGGKRVKG